VERRTTAERGGEKLMVGGGFKSEVAGRRRRGTNMFFVDSLSHVVLF